MLNKLLSHRSFQLLVLLLLFIWLDTGSLILGRITGVLLLLFSIGAHIYPDLLKADEIHPSLKIFYQKFGSILFLLLAGSSFFNLHTGNSVMEGIFILIFFSGILILVVLDKTKEDRKEKYTSIFVCIIFILVSMLLIIWPEPTHVGLYDILIYIGIIREMFKGKPSVSRHLSEMTFRQVVLETFKYEENTIFHVENWLKHNGLPYTRQQVKSDLLQLLQEDLLKIHEAPMDIIDFERCEDEFIEDFWFAITAKGRSLLED